MAVLSAAQFAGLMDKRASAVRKSERDVVEVGARAAKEAMMRIARQDMGGDLSLSNWRGSRVMVGYEITGSRAVVKPRDSKGGAVVRVLEEGAGPHWITRRKKGSARRRGRGRPSLKIGGQFVGRSVLHKGSKAQRTFSQGADVAVRKANKEMTEMLVRLFGQF